MNVLSIARDLLHEARSRKWFIVLALGITVALGVLALTLRMDVVDGALAATSLFGKPLGTDVRAADVALRPMFKAVSYIIFYGGISFGVLGCADFAPALLSPGRIELLLSLPVARWELLVGSFIGVLALACAGAAYGAGGVIIVLGVKTGVWTLRPLLSALVASVTFSSVYAAMLAAAVFVRSSALSAALGGTLAIAGIVAGYRSSMLDLFQAGLGRDAFSLLTALFPQISVVCDASAALAASEPVDGAAFVRVLGGVLVFGAASLAFGIWRFENKDY